MTAKANANTSGRSLNDLLWGDIEYDEHDELLRNKRQDAGIDLCSLLSHANISRADLARLLNWKPSRVTKALSGNENLTINTLASIIDALGMDFDLVFRKKGACRTLQPWERDRLDEEIIQMHGELVKVLGNAEDLHNRAKATLQTSIEINRTMFKRAHAIKQSTMMESMRVQATFRLTSGKGEFDAAVAG